MVALLVLGGMAALAVLGKRPGIAAPDVVVDKPAPDDNVDGFSGGARQEVVLDHAGPPGLGDRFDSGRDELAMDGDYLEGPDAGADDGSYTVMFRRRIAPEPDLQKQVTAAISAQATKSIAGGVGPVGTIGQYGGLIGKGAIELAGIDAKSAAPALAALSNPLGTAVSAFTTSFSAFAADIASEGPIGLFANAEERQREAAIAWNKLSDGSKEFYDGETIQSAGGESGALADDVLFSSPRGGTTSPTAVEESLFEVGDL